jgi:hypothetical protein
MMKPLLTGIAACAALAVVVPAYAKVHHTRQHAAAAVGLRLFQPMGSELGARPGYPTSFRIPAQPLVWDCVHVMFPQCGRGYDNLNDGSFK